LAEKNYTWGTGRRKCAVARVRIKKGSGRITINERDIADYFPKQTLQFIVNQPLEAASMSGQLDVFVNVCGGGISGQAGAVRHGIARALLALDGDNREAMRSNGFLTRDSRMVERKKYGLRGARRRFQFSKR
jgi:small subunit ribosomal protein S9